MSTFSSDKDLLKALKKGEQSAYAHIYKSYFSMIRYFITKNSGDDAEANDVFQDAMIALFEQVQQPDFSIKATVKTYLYSICRNIWLAQLRKKGKTTSLTDFEEFIAVENTSDADELTERQWNILEQCLDQLGDPCKGILTQYYYFRKSMEEIAELFGYTNAGNAKNQKYRCLKRLKTMALAL